MIFSPRPPGLSNFFARTGNRSSAAWGVAGVAIASAAATFTDTSSSGTVATAVAHSFGQPTLAASSATTYTAAANVYIAGDAIAGSNVTLTATYGLWNAGKTRLDGVTLIGTAVNTSSTLLQIGTNTTTSAGGLLFGTDVSLYRSGSNKLSTGAEFVFGGNIGVPSNCTLYNANSSVFLLFSTSTFTVQTAGANNALVINSTQQATFYSTVITAASTTGAAGLRLPHGTAPTSPTDGDEWTTTAGKFIRINGVTKTFTLT